MALCSGYCEIRSIAKRSVAVRSTMRKKFQKDRNLVVGGWWCDPGQFDFIPEPSFTFALISMLLHWLRAKDGTGSTVRTALLDYRKKKK